ncbi:helix-turn-helix transcriptional regulator [Chromobacterium subtsugae]|nr:AlpA family transcriptional regulator [Chromobacterium subtsugae]
MRPMQFSDSHFPLSISLFPPVVNSQICVFPAFQVSLLCGDSTQQARQTRFEISEILHSLIGVSDCIHRYSAKTIRTNPMTAIAPSLTAQPLRFLRLPEVISTCGLSRSSVYDAIKRGSFPAPVPLGGKSVAWLSSEIDAWMVDRIAARHA